MRTPELQGNLSLPVCAAWGGGGKGAALSNWGGGAACEPPGSQSEAGRSSTCFGLEPDFGDSRQHEAGALAVGLSPQRKALLCLAVWLDSIQDRAGPGKVKLLR